MLRHIEESIVSEVWGFAGQHYTLLRLVCVLLLQATLPNLREKRVNLNKAE